MPRIMDNGRTNPLITVTREEIEMWLRKLADEAGFADRESCAVHIHVEHEFIGGNTFHPETPELTLMVSNIPNSRQG